ncbi:hypothetical protein A628_01544 [Salmonella enterica subsp. enterica serovar Cubana str. 76814]|uniref:Uncharacterized protein n=1 Tax=Salmonella enterica subsp. enterica serovar Cubana str. 76814 TaxID=1192560 RepID=V7ISX1_SALET|nr:hypothetical protein A628_01544 [Salmonella enterica subsp. enterica serovar Cubana str. 76814]
MWGNGCVVVKMASWRNYMRTPAYIARWHCAYRTYRTLPVGRIRRLRRYPA